MHLDSGYRLYVWDGVVDAARTFGGRIFKLAEHVDRLFASLKYVGIDIGLSPLEVTRLTQEATERNVALLGPDEDYWIFHHVSGGPDAPDGPPTVVAAPRCDRSRGGTGLWREVRP